MASAYGGVAKPRIRKVGQRFANITRIDRSGLHTSQAARPANPKMQNLTSARPTLNETADISTNPIQTRKDSSKHGGFTVGGTTDRTATQTQGIAGMGQNTASGWRTGALPDSVDSHADNEADQASVVEQPRVKRTAEKRKRKKLQQNKQKHSQIPMPKVDRTFEDEFEKIYKKDIDKFIDGSDFEVESLGGFSEISKGTFKSAVQNPRMKGLEKVYLQRLEF